MGSKGSKSGLSKKLRAIAAEISADPTGALELRGLLRVVLPKAKGQVFIPPTCGPHIGYGLFPMGSLRPCSRGLSLA